MNYQPNPAQSAIRSGESLWCADCHAYHAIGLHTNPAPSGPVQTEQFSSPGSQRASCPEAVNDGDALDCPLPGGEPAPDRHEASRAAFEAAHPYLSHAWNETKNRYRDSTTLGLYEVWCAALDHAAQEQPAKDGSTVGRLREALLWYESKVALCNGRQAEHDAARDALAKDIGSRARAALTETKEDASNE